METDKILGIIVALILITSGSYAWYTDDASRVTDLKIYSDSSQADCNPLGECTTFIKIDNVSGVNQKFLLDALFPKTSGVTITNISEQATRTITKTRYITEPCKVKVEDRTDDKNGFRYTMYLCKESGKYYNTDKGLTYWFNYF